MPMDGFTLGLVAEELNAALTGARVDKITQPEPDELDLMIRCVGETKTLLLSANAGSARLQTTNQKKSNPLEPSSFCMLLRKKISGSRIAGISQYMSDRIIDIDFDTTDELGDKQILTITCECMGRHSNLILYDADGRILESARHIPLDVSSVRQVLPGLRYERPPMQDKLTREEGNIAALAERLRACTGLLRKALTGAISGLSEQTGEEMAVRIAGDADAQCDAAQSETYAREAIAFCTENKPDPVVYYDENGKPADICAFPYQCRSHMRCEHFASISQAMDVYYTERDTLSRIQQKSTALRHVLRKNIERIEKKLAIRMQTLQDAEHMEDFRIKGELLTSAAASIPKGAKSISLANWYDPDYAEIEITLDESISAIHNAQRYFKQYQKMRVAARMAQQQIAESREELAYLEGQLDNLEKSTDERDLQEIRTELEREGYVHASHNRRKMKALSASVPLHFVSSTGREILVGKNNVQNESLTFSADGNEMWLHVKDMPGSHVIIRGANPDETSCMEAAMLAAYYSKGKNSSNVPVDITLRKFVKKPSGSRPGFVTFTHQRTVYVTPDEHTVNALQH